MPMFDPETGKVVDPDALRSLQFNGKGMKIPRTVIRDDKKITETFDESTGRTDGYFTEHGSGRIDCNVFPQAVNVTAGT